MAVFKVINEKYNSEQDLYNLLDYCIRGSSNTITWEVFDYGAETIKNQFLYVQNCKGTVLETRAHHYILSFDTATWEQFMSFNLVNNCMELFNGCYFHDYQHICCLHNKKGQIHFHVIVNPVSLVTHKIFHCSKTDYYRWCKDISFMLGASFGFAVQNISYINEEGKYRYGKNTGVFLYQNRMFPWEKL